MKNKLLTIDNVVFLLSALISAFICYSLLGPQNVILGVVSILFTFIVYSAKPNNGDYFYTFLWLAIILSGCYIGIWLKLSVGFYIFLFLVSNYYYITYQKDSFSDRAIPFLVIYASLGTTMKGLGYESAIAFFIGTIVALVVLGVVHKSKIEFTAFKNGIFSKSLYVNPPHVLFSSIVYSGFLFLCLYLPDKIGFERPYWVPMTFIILLKPKEENLLPNTITRFLGSVAGAIVVLVLLNIDRHYKIIDIAIVVTCIFLLPSFFKLNNLVKTFGITVFILLLLELAGYWGDPNYTLPPTRIFETFMGGLFALMASMMIRFIRRHNIG